MGFQILIFGPKIHFLHIGVLKLPFNQNYYPIQAHLLISKYFLFTIGLDFS
jgi:hypothetical protein